MPFSSLHDRPKREMEHWVIAGGCALTFLSATANAGFLIELGTSVSHLTGDVSKVAVEFAQGTHRVVELAMNLLVATLSFLLGATIAGYAIHHPSLEISRPYGRAVMVIRLHAPFLLVVASLYVAGGLSWSIYKHWFSAKMK